jgi:hypothetical protein
MVLYGKEKEVYLGRLISSSAKTITSKLSSPFFKNRPMYKKFKRVKKNGEIQRAIIYGTEGDCIVYYDSNKKGMRKRLNKPYNTIKGAHNFLKRIGFTEVPKRPKGQYQLELRNNAIERIRKWLTSRHEFIRLLPIANSSKISMTAMVEWLKNDKIEITDEQYKSLRECIAFIKGGQGKSSIGQSCMTLGAGNMPGKY